LVFQRNGRVHLYRRGCQFSRLLAAEVCASAVVMLDRPCPIQCKTVGYPLHSPFFPSLLHPCVSVCHHIPFPLLHPGQRRLSVVLENVYETLVRERSAGGQWAVLSPVVRFLRTLHQMHFRNCIFNYHLH